MSRDSRSVKRVYPVGMEVREMKSLLALAEFGSILLASQRCNLSPAAVHKHLKTLEDEIGAPLYEKHEGRLVLTHAGQMLLPFVREILRHYEAAIAMVSEWKVAKRGIVRVGAGPTFSTYLLPGLVKRFRRQHQAVDVFVETGGSGHLMDRLRSGALDLIFDVASASLEDEQLEQTAVWESPAGFIAAAGKSPSTMKLAKLEKSPFILFQAGTRMEGIVGAYLNSLNFRPKVVMRSDSSEAIKSMVRAGLGVSVLFLWNVSADPHAASFQVVRTDAPKLVSRMALVKMRTAYTPGPVRAFIEMARRTNWKDLHLASMAGSSA